MTMAMELIRHIAGLYGGKAIKGDFTQVFITGNEIWMAQQVLAEQAEGVQGEREALPYWEPCNPACDPELNGFRDRKCHCAQARAALAQPSPSYAGFPKPTVLKGCNVRYAANAQPSPAPELERPEVVAWSNWKVGTRSHVPFRTEVEAARSVNASEIAATQEGPYSVEPLMTVAQHDRIVGALRAEVERNKRTIDGMNEAHAKLAGLYEGVQARLADMEKQEPIGWWAQYCENPMRRMVHWGANLPECATATFHPFYAAPVAQAGQVPEAVREAIKWADHLLFECGALVQTRAPSIHVYNQTYAAVEAAKVVLAAAPAQGGSADE